MNYLLFEKYPEVFAFSTERNGGVSVGNYTSLNLCDYTGDMLCSVEENRQIFCDANGISQYKLFMPHQTHGSRVEVLDEDFLKLSTVLQRQRLEGVDALVTNLRGVCVGVSTADCVPILLFDSVQKVVAVVHAGWRGTLAKIVINAIEKMCVCFASSPANVLAQIAPCVSFDNYEVGVELVTLFQNEGFPIEQLFLYRGAEKYCFDLKSANKFLLEQAGVLPSNIAVSEFCTFRDYERFFSARRLEIKSGRIFSCMMLKQ